MLNQCQFIGNLGHDPELRHSQSGTAIANISVGVSEKYKDKETTEWVRCVAFNNLAEICGKYLSKGSKVYISGRMQTRKWQDQSGNDRYSTEIILERMLMLDRREKRDDYSMTEGEANEPITSDNLEDEIPF